MKQRIIPDWMMRIFTRKPAPKPHRSKGWCVCGREITKTKDGKNFLMHNCRFGQKASPDVATVERAMSHSSEVEEATRGLGR